MRVTTAALITRGAHALFVRRPPGGDLGGLWELPGGKVDDGESPERALARELAEELCLDAAVGRELCRTTFVHRERFTLICYEVRADLGALCLREHEASRWCTVEEALELDLAPSDRRVLLNLGRQVR